MSLSTGTPEPRQHAARRKPAAKKSAPRRTKAKPAAPASTATPRLVDAERLFRRFVQMLPEGDHAFSQLNQEFAEWCECGHIAPPSRTQLATWLRQAGLVSYRSGRAKITIYAKSRRALAA